MELYLITGFLGAGKTTFLKELLHILTGKRIYLIINEFGKTGVDGALLQEMNYAIAEINNGSIFCACRLDKFEEALLKAKAEEPDIIIVEASGLSDPTAVKKLLSSSIYSDIIYKGSICLVDASRFEKVVNTAQVCKKQLSVSSLVLLNKTDMVSLPDIQRVNDLIKQINPWAQIQQTRFGHMEKEWLECISRREAITPQAVFDNEAYLADITLQKACITLSEKMSLESLTAMLKQLAYETYRIKGFVNLQGRLMLVDCVGPELCISDYKGTVNDRINSIVLLAGKGMQLRKAIKQAVEWYGENIMSVE